MANEKNVDVLLKVKEMEPVVSESGSTSTVTGLKITLADGTVKTVQTKALIDATQDADMAAAAGVPYTTGREDLGDQKSRMAVTLVFRLKNITPEVWQKMAQRLQNDNDPERASTK